MEKKFGHANTEKDNCDGEDDEYNNNNNYSTYTYMLTRM